MTQKNNGKSGNQTNEGFVPGKRGYKPGKVSVTGGHKPEKSQAKPVNPPKKK